MTTARWPLGLAQRDALLDQSAWPASSHLLLGGYGLLEGEIEPALLAEAAEQLAAEQPVLRLIPGLDGQRLLPALSGVLHWLPPATAPDPHAAVQAAWTGWVREPPPLGSEAERPPWRLGALRVADGRTAVIIWAHHALLDGWATQLLMRRWGQWCTALRQGVPPPPCEPERFAQHLQQEAAYRDGPAWQQDAAYWRETLAELGAPLRPPPTREQRASGRLPPAVLCRLPLARDAYAEWAKLARLEHQTEFATLAAALVWHEARVHGRDELVLGVPTLNRHGHAERQALGMFVGVLPLRLRLTGLRTPRELVALIGRELRQGLRHARFPASEMARELRFAQSGRDSAFDVLLSFERQDYRLAFGPARLTDSHQLFSGVARFPLCLTLCDFGANQPLELVFEGSSQFFDARSLELLGRRVTALAQCLATQPEAALSTLPLLPAAEREAVLDGLHRNLARLDPAPSFIERFCEQATLHPRSPALRWDGGQLHHAELRQRVEALAGRLLQAGLQREQIVPLVLGRGVSLLVAMLAVARAGGAFLPLDPEAPEARLRQLLDQCAASLWLGDRADAPRLAALHPGWLAVDDDGPTSAAPALPPFPTEDQLAYALFTSGSSGRPKAVAVEHGALARRFAWLATTWNLGPDDVSLQGTQAGFDPALIELLLPLTLGGSVALPPAGRQQPASWAAFALRHGCSFTALVPATLGRLLDGIAALSEVERSRLRLRVACCGGEVLPPPLVQRWFALLRAAPLWNVYGPTEACIFATAWACRADEPTAVLPVGSPVDETRLHVLGADLQPLPFGAVGDIWLGGRTLARGYLFADAQANAAFIADPFQPELANARLYRTGDRGWLDGEGRLQFLGRADRQLKIRGQRVEPGEAEALLLSLPGVQEACVLPWGEPPRLQAWLAPDSLDLQTLQRQARALLPEALLPAGFTLLAALPRSRSGKLEPRRLPPPQQPASGRLPRPPATPLEHELLALLRETLGKTIGERELGVDDDFFAIGGDSLAALDWLAAVERRTGLHAELAWLAQAPSVAQLAARLQRSLDPATTATSAVAALALPLSQASGAPTLYLAASGHGDLLRFQQLAQALAPHAALQMLQPPPGRPLASLSELAAGYGAHILAHSGGAPVLLAGFSVGGVAALETARWLAQRGSQVQALVLIDSVFPRWLLRQPWLWKLLGWLTRSLYVQELSMNGRRLGAMFKDQGLVGQVLALHRYRPQAYAGEVLLLRTSGLARWQAWLFGPWRRWLRLREHEVQGLHGSVFEPGRVGGLAQCLCQALGLAPADTSP